MKNLLVIGALLGASFAYSNPPLVVIVEQRAAVVDGEDPNVPIAGYLAELLSLEMRVRPVVWSAADPTFRDWISAGKAPKVEGEPTPAQIERVAQSAEVDYVILVSALRSGNQISGALSLFRKKIQRPIWLNPQQMSLTVGGKTDLENAGMSLANTWTNLLSGDPFKSLKPTRAGTNTEDKPLPQPETPKPQPETPALPAFDPKTVLDQADAFLRQGMRNEAILALRAGIDQAPTDLRLRIRLIQELQNAGMLELAAEEATRYAELSGGSTDQLLNATVLWLEVGRPVEAQESLNQARARGAKGHQVDLLQGRLYVIQDRFPQAAESFRASVEAQSTAEGWLGLALAEAWQGRLDQLKAALDALQGATFVDALASYRWAVQACDQRQRAFIEDFQESHRYAVSQPGAPQAVSRFARVRVMARSVAALMDGLIPPTLHTGSHDRRRLAMRLLVQASEEAFEFAGSGDEGVGEEAMLSLEEALTLSKQIAEEYERELAGK